MLLVHMYLTHPGLLYRRGQTIVGPPLLQVRERLRPSASDGHQPVSCADPRDAGVHKSTTACSAIQRGPAGSCSHGDASGDFLLWLRYVTSEVKLISGHSC
jgi:hypothetical protein